MPEVETTSNPKDGKSKITIPNIAIGIMLIGILIPSIKYSLSLYNPSPAQLTIAICLTIFSSVIFIWILDLVSIIKLRNEWMSKSIYGAAIVTILGVTVAVFKNGFNSQVYPFEGCWNIRYESEDSPIFDYKTIIKYDKQGETYWGYSEFKQPPDSTFPRQFEIKSFNPQENSIELNIVAYRGYFVNNLVYTTNCVMMSKPSCYVEFHYKNGIRMTKIY